LAGFATGALAQKPIEEAAALVERQVKSGDVNAAALLVRHKGRAVRDLNPKTVFLLASITKPMTAAGLMILRDRGMLSLDDPARKYIPEFTGGDRDMITIQHLLTHTSGLPDMLPENVELRKRHAPLKEFVAATCKTPLLFKPGTQTKYQSMGILLAAEIAERVTKMPFRDFLRKELFAPLGMNQTALGLGQHRRENLVRGQVAEPSDWDWNSQYWRDFGAPWGGVHSTSGDVATFVEEFVRPKLFRPATARDMIRNQNEGLNKPWGVGWMIEPGAFGKSCSARTYGHWGSTGTVAWHDPEKDLTCVLLTTKPAADSRNHLLGPVSDLVSQAG
jgi:CubicO group peptidase (beta-lactamase class C family)